MHQHPILSWSDAPQTSTHRGDTGSCSRAHTQSCVTHMQLFRPNMHCNLHTAHISKQAMQTPSVPREQMALVKRNVAQKRALPHHAATRQCPAETHAHLSEPKPAITHTRTSRGTSGRRSWVCCSVHCCRCSPPPLKATDNKTVTVKAMVLPARHPIKAEAGQAVAINTSMRPETSY
jgi:hypothetical protein